MARKLPWLSGTNSKGSNTNPRNDKRPAVQHRKLRTSENESNHDQVDDVRDTTPRARSKARVARNPSSSPPPPPPETEFMKDGLAGDDIWVMVEDEFLAMAKAFTAHLHHAEYQRLKGLARAGTKRKSDGSSISNSNDKDWADSVGRTIARPVDGMAQLSVEARNWVRAEELREEQGRTLKSVGADLQGRKSDEEDEWEDDVWRSNPRLAGLMVRREHSTRLVGLVGTQTQTQRPAKAVGRARDDTLISLCSEDDDDDDLDSPVGRQVAVSGAGKDSYGVIRHSGPSGRYIRPSENPSRRKEQPIQSGTIPSSPPELPPSPPLAPSRAKSRWSSRGKPVEDALDDTSWRSKFEQKMAKRKAEAANTREDKKRKSLRLDEIPTFLV